MTEINRFWIRDVFLGGKIIDLMNSIITERNHLGKLTLSILEKAVGEIKTEHPELVDDLQGEDWELAADKINELWKEKLSTTMTGYVDDIEKGFRAVAEGFVKTVENLFLR
jgi:hypothetical protein